MIARAARFASIMLQSFNFGMSLAHALEMGPKRELRGPEYAVAQRIYRRFGRAAGVTMPGAVSATLLSGALSHDQWKTMPPPRPAWRPRSPSGGSSTSR
jgi:hypothetical protein